MELSLVQRRGLLQNEEVEVAFREYLLMRQSDLYRYGNFKLVANWGKCINVLGVGVVVLFNICAAATFTVFSCVATSWLIFTT